MFNVSVTGEMMRVLKEKHSREMNLDVVLVVADAGKGAMWVLELRVAYHETGCWCRGIRG